jgi:hypothetical protein
MGIFSSIKDAIFGRKAPARTPSPPPSPNEITGVAPEIRGTVTNRPQPPEAIDEVDVEANLSRMAAGKDLNWRTSIVDLMKLVGIDSSLANRKELARELGYTGELDGSAEMNIWLHKATMKELAANGGKVPADMMD